MERKAAEHGGLTTVRKALKDISQEALVIVEESKKDDAADEDNDGVSDVKQISGKALVKRKLKLVLTKMDPNKVNAAIQSIYKVWMSVLAVLTIKFARTIALALSISEFVEKIVNRFILPIIKGATPPEYQVRFTATTYIYHITQKFPTDNFFLTEMGSRDFRLVL